MSRDASPPGSPRPRVVLLCGPAGSGKSTTARVLEAEGYLRLGWDEEAARQGFHGYPLPEGAEQQVHAVVQARLAAAVAEGRDVVVDTSFWQRARRQAYRDLLTPLGVEPVTYYLQVPLDVLLERVARRTGAGPDDVVLDEATVRRFVAGFEVPTPQEGPLRVLDGRGPLDGWG